MNVWVRLVTITVVVATVAGVGGYFAWTYFPPDPYAHIAFFTEQDDYEPSEKVGFVIANVGGLKFSWMLWSVEHFVGDEWVLAECHDTAMVARIIQPFSRLVFHWTVGAPNSPEETCGFPLPPLEPGPFRGSLFLHSLDRDVESRRFLAEFDVV